ncbi:division/outer membrane stress-associated lipid-binding lipoprotein [Blochmannia endosymbiont of Camponotus nipponensis]|uniref:division/outer membrane stress-associated lipid-binding lipoprotein n=1 Tax=Blochmannia endosymbiont of Camponotus nipponensis TaxID=2681986 RepID=UPI00135BA2E6|nr:division/outer membrane stress-associated lipid-binding lipoprotein [Blochmannia endosymbiont of Camponotus nipponensis]
MNIKYHIIIQTLLISFFVLTLHACCSSILTIGSAALITTTWNDPRTIGTQLDDSILKAHIAHALHKNQHIKKSSRIKSTVYQGNVLLTGQTSSISIAEEAIQIVMQINGTKNIYNAIRQNTPICTRSILIDIWISSQIRLNLFIKKGINTANIKIITENKEVFLLGIVTHEENKYTKKIANSVNGVKNVFTVFSYT